MKRPQAIQRSIILDNHLVNRAATLAACSGVEQSQWPCSLTWLTVAPTEPCSSICNILASGCSRCVATASSLVFFCMSSMATSIGVRSNYKRNIKRCIKRPAQRSNKAPRLRHLPLLSESRWSESSRRGRRAWWWGWSSSCIAHWVHLVDARSW